MVKSGELIDEPVTNLDLAIESATKNNGIVMDSITKKVVYPDPGKCYLCILRIVPRSNSWNFFLYHIQ